MTGLANENTTIFTHHSWMEESEIAVQVTDLSLTTGMRTVDDLTFNSKLLVRIHHSPKKSISRLNKRDQAKFFKIKWNATNITNTVPTVTLTISFRWMAFCSESRAVAVRFSLRRCSACGRTDTTLPCMFNICQQKIKSLINKIFV